MRRLLAILLLAIARGWAADPAGFEGHWLGSLAAGPVIRLRIALHLSKAPDGSYTGTMDSLDQAAYGIPVTKIVQKDRILTLEIGRIPASFEGELDPGSSQIRGRFTQAGATLPLVFKRVEHVAELNRPQEPRKPYPYGEEQVDYQNRAARVRLAGTLTLPRSSGPHPAVLLITGSGPQDRDESMFGHKPFLVLADYLTRRGIAVLRADDRGVGGSTGNLMQATSEDLAGDALAGVEFLQARKDIDAHHIGLIGHSEGGLIAPLVATRSAGVGFIVLMAGPGVRGDQVLLEQADRIAGAMGISGAVLEHSRALQKAVFDVLEREKDNTVAERMLREEIARRMGTFPREEQAAIQPVAGLAEAEIRFMLTAWFRAFLRYDPRPTLRSVRVPVLALGGELDTQVSSAQNLPVIAEALEAGGNRDYAVVKLPGLNHLFQTARTGSPTEYGQIEETIAPAALAAIGDWIARHVRP